MKKILYGISLIILFFFPPFELCAQTPPPLNYRIGGTITANGKIILKSSFARFNLSIKVTKDGNIPLNPVAEATSLLSSGIYAINIPVKDSSYPGAAALGEILEIHVYKGDTEVPVTTPVNTEITMGAAGESNYNININIIAEILNTSSVPAANLLLLD